MNATKTGYYEADEMSWKFILKKEWPISKWAICGAFKEHDVRSGAVVAT